MYVNDIVEFTIQATDLDGLEQFYVRAFGLEVLSREDDRRWLKVGDRTRLGLWTPGRKEFGDQGGRHVHFALAAKPQQLDAIADRLSGEMGAEIVGPIEHDGGDRSIYVRDPAGNLVEVWDYFDHGRPIDDLG